MSHKILERDKYRAKMGFSDDPKYFEGSFPSHNDFTIVKTCVCLKALLNSWDTRLFNFGYLFTRPPYTFNGFADDYEDPF